MHVRGWWIAVALFVTLAGTGAEAKEVKIPGLEMDALSTRVFDAWEAMEVNLGRDGVTYAECRLRLTPAFRPGTVMAAGTYRYDLVESKITWTKGAGAQVERNWWRFEVDNLLRMVSRKFLLAHSQMTAEQDATGTRLRVVGRSPYRQLRFDARGVLTGASVMLPGPGGKTYPAEIGLTHRKHGGRYLLQAYSMSGTLPRVGAVVEKGTIDYVPLHGRPLPARIALDLQMGPQKLAVVLSLDAWKEGVEIGPEMDAPSRAAFERWESQAYNLGRRRVRKATCRVEVRSGPRRATGRYRWDGKKGAVAWDDAEAAGPLAKGDWSRTLDRLFVRYPLRRDLFGWTLKGKQEGARTVVLAEDQFGLDPVAEGPSTRRFVFGAKGSLVEMTVGGTAEKPEGVVRLGHRRVEHAPGTIFAGSLRYLLPVSWSGTWHSPWDPPYTTSKSLAFALMGGEHVPSQLTLRFKDAEGERVRTFLFSGWSFTKEPSTIGK